MSFRTFSLLILCIWIYLCNGQDVGQPCVKRRSKEKGVCQLLNRCPSALNDLIQGRRPVRCGFVGDDPVVCCQNQSGAKSKQKCKEYAQYVLERIQKPNGEVQTVSTCAFKTVALIVNGEDAKPREFPHQAVLGYGSRDDVKWKCGGSLISENFILTAAHCCKRSDPPRYVRLGELDLTRTDDDADPQDYIVDEIISHPYYNPPSLYNDIALLKLNRRVQFNKYIRPACLHTTYDIIKKPEDKYAKFIATGWGKREVTHSSGSSILQKVILEHFLPDECKEVYKNRVSKKYISHGISDQTQLCSGGRNEPKDTCSGDSGGPLQIVNPSEYCTYEIVGVTSFGISCGASNIPGVYTRVSNYIKWIEENVWPD